VLNISRLLFANDTMIFCGANPNLLVALFLYFECVSRLKINVGNVNNVDGLANILDCGVFSLPLKYLEPSLKLLLRPNLFGMVLLRRSSWLEEDELV
jgi:hypothetical protein